MTKRQQHNGAFKTHEALEAISGAWTVNKIASEYGAHPVQITQWKQVVLESLPQVVSSQRESRAQGGAAIRSLEMAEMPGMRGRDHKVFDNLGPVEVQFLSPRCRGDARSPRSRLILNTVKRERKAVTLNPPANPVEHSCVGVGTRTHV
jgi:transposase-like protein